MQGVSGVNDILAILFAAVAIIGAVSAHIQHDRFNKIIAVGIIFGGIIPFIVDRGYLDIAILTIQGLSHAHASRLLSRLWRVRQ